MSTCSSPAPPPPSSPPVAYLATAAMPPPPRPSSSSPPPATPHSVQVFAPKPLRILNTYLPGGSTGSRSLQLAAARTPSPALSTASSSHSHSHSRRNSRSGSIVSVSESEGEQMVRLYSPGPSNDVSVLDDFLKLVRSNHSAKVLRHHLPPPPNVSPLSLRGSASDGTGGGASASKSASGSGSGGGGGKKQWDGGIIIPASPVSRTLTRNPMIYNSQFGLVPEES